MLCDAKPHMRSNSSERPSSDATLGLCSSSNAWAVTESGPHAAGRCMNTHSMTNRKCTMQRSTSSHRNARCGDIQAGTDARVSRTRSNGVRPRRTAMAADDSTPLPPPSELACCSASTRHCAEPYRNKSSYTFLRGVRNVWNGAPPALAAVPMAAGADGADVAPSTDANEKKLPGVNALDDSAVADLRSRAACAGSFRTLCADGGNVMPASMVDVSDPDDGGTSLARGTRRGSLSGVAVSDDDSVAARSCKSRNRCSACLRRSSAVRFVRGATLGDERGVVDRRRPGTRGTAPLAAGGRLARVERTARLPDGFPANGALTLPDFTAGVSELAPALLAPGDCASVAAAPAAVGESPAPEPTTITDADGGCGGALARAGRWARSIGRRARRLTLDRVRGEELVRVRGFRGGVDPGELAGVELATDEAALPNDPDRRCSSTRCDEEDGMDVGDSAPNRVPSGPAGSAGDGNSGDGPSTSSGEALTDIFGEDVVGAVPAATRPGGLARGELCGAIMVATVAAAAAAAIWLDGGEGLGAARRANRGDSAGPAAADASVNTGAGAVLGSRGGDSRT